MDPGEDAGGRVASALEADGLSKAFGGVTAVDGVSLDVEQGEFFSLIGPSGCGKTTTLRMLAGLEAPDAGVVRIDGEPVTDQPARTRDTNMVFQDLVLFPHMTVAENVGYGLARDGVDATERRRRVDEVLSLVDLDGFGDRDPTALSGGQQQRVALARALVNDPAVLLLDEPLSSLDRSLRTDMQTEFARIQRESETTFLYVTHDQESAMSMSDRIAVMRDGRVVDVGSPRRLYTRPKTAFVASFLGDAATLRGEVTAIDDDGTTVETTAGPVAAEHNGADTVVGDEATVVVRPDAITVGEGPLSGVVVDSAYKGFYEEATVELDGGDRLTVRAESAAATPTAGEPDGGKSVAALPDEASDDPVFRVGEAVSLRVDDAVLVRDDTDGDA